MKKVSFLFLFLLYTFHAYPLSHAQYGAMHALVAQKKMHVENIYNEGFLAGTIIATPDGYKFIEEIQEGDVVIGYNLVTNTYEEKEVLGISSKHITQYVKIVANNETIYTGLHQRFYLLQEDIWIYAYDLALSDILGGESEALLIEHIEKIYDNKIAYAVSVDGHNFCITSHNILVHNTDAAIECAFIILQIGRMALKHPSLAILGQAVDLTIACLALQQQYNKKLKTSTQTQENFTPERMCYEKIRTELYQIRDAFVKIKNDLTQIIQYQYPHMLSFNNTLLQQQSPYKDILSAALKITPAKELQYDEQQKIQLKELRQSELKQIEKQIFDLQITLAFHFNELIDGIQNAFIEYNDFLPTAISAGRAWKSTPHHLKIQEKAVKFAYENLFLEQSLLKNIEHKNQILKCAIAYYKNINNASVLKKTTNIADLIAAEEKNVLANEKIIGERKTININNIKSVEVFLAQRNINITHFKNNIINKINKQRESHIAKELQEAEKRRLAIKDPENSDDMNKEKKMAKDECHPHGRYKDAGYHHANSKGLKSPALKNGQKALNNSVSYSKKPKNIPSTNNSTSRIGVSEGEIVVLNEASPGLYHGHVRAWNELEEYMERALEIGNLVKNGKIL